MDLNYFKSNNFGDALNPYIFEHFLPDFFDTNTDVSFVGIGSILGLDHVANAKKKVVFSSGFAYGSLPLIDDSFDIFCVRGPLTCDILNISKKFAICDGAILLQFIETAAVEKKYQYSFMPHWESLEKFDWQIICERSNVHFINPTDDIHSIIKQIKQTEVMIAEAMHAAIVADALRVPWVPVKAYGGINHFKWEDWTTSLDLEYCPVKVTSLYNNTNFTKRVIKEKTGYPFSFKSLSPVLSMYESYQNMFLIQKVVKEFEELKTIGPFLSKDSILRLKGEQLVSTLHTLRNKYELKV